MPFSLLQYCRLTRFTPYSSRLVTWRASSGRHSRENRRTQLWSSLICLWRGEGLNISSGDKRWKLSNGGVCLLAVAAHLRQCLAKALTFVSYQENFLHASIGFFVPSGVAPCLEEEAAAATFTTFNSRNGYKHQQRPRQHFRVGWGDDATCTDAAMAKTLTDCTSQCTDSGQQWWSARGRKEEDAEEHQFGRWTVFGAVKV